MKKALLIGMLMMTVILSACSNNSTSSVPATEEEVQETVQNFYNEMSKLEESGKTSLAEFNEAIAGYSAGELTDKQLEKKIKQFQSTATDLSNQAEKVKISSSLPEDIRKLLEESKVAFESAYSLKEEASQGADSANVTAEQFNELNQNADVAMLFGISKLNEAREATGLIDSEGQATSESGDVVQE
ncbi:hypothetical protein [Paenibacillus sp. FSL L8-0506]|uniref:hypothetical protein n=1 Tax=Paenibacillus sp. FSL L8-0506 TaxID=2975335 RepID=UPI0030F97B65